jgi:hypothetical protein
MYQYGKMLGKWTISITSLLIISMMGCEEDTMSADSDLEEMRIKEAEYNKNISKPTICGTNTCTYDSTGEQLSSPEIYVFGVINRDLATVEGLSEYTGFERVTTCEEAREYQKLNREFRELFPPLEEVETERDRLPVEPTLDIEKNGIWEGEPSTKRGILQIRYSGGSCSGVSIAPHWIMTAGHCNIVSSTISLSYFENDLQYTERNLPYARFVNPDYSGEGDVAHDIALLYVPTLSSTMTKYYRLWVDKIPQYQKLHIWGWGISGGPDGNCSGAGVLRQGKDFSRIIVSSWPLPYNFYAEADEARGCPGDSGGPAILKWNTTYNHVFGIYSGAVFSSDTACCPCKGCSMLWVSLKRHMSWIENTLGMFSTTCLHFRDDISEGDYIKCF